jgi:hypothetical protein
VSASATVTRSGALYRLRVELVGRGAPREVTGASCLTVAHAAALMIAIAVDPEAARFAPRIDEPMPEPPAAAVPGSSGAAGVGTPSLPGGTPPGAAAPGAAAPGGGSGAGATAPGGAPPPGERAAPLRPAPPGKSPARASPGRTARAAPTPSLPASTSRAPGAPAATGASPPPDTSAAPPATPGSGPRWHLFAGATADSATIGRVSAAAEVGGGAVLGPLRIDAAAMFWPERSLDTTTPSASGATTGANVDLTAGWLGACFAPPVLARLVGPRFELDVPCAALELGRMHAEGYGVSDPGEAALLWFAARAGVAGGIVASPWLALRMRLEAVVPLRSPIFELGGVGIVHQPAFSGRATVSLEARP